ncbi:ABC transporter ATP-binding protein [Brevundimonas aveniformis]|uniref:ABC transporter ATP-binding protein n=1 Tax=Brevundimonas aveniformis TaxID=370977 RepID=UPI000421138B|nr:ABC transporter ATP-binding protein [Brevundimonas aveniformis]
MSRLSIRNLHARQGAREVVSGVNLEVPPREMVALVGPNGAGKSTLMLAAAGLHRITRGESRLDGEVIHKVDVVQRSLRLGYLPQERRLAWGMPALEVAALGAPFSTPPAARERGREALALFGIEDLAATSVFALSGGERARVLLARLFATQASLLMADEPVAGLDPDAQLMCLERLRDHSRAGGSVLVTLHDLTLAARFADRVAVLDQGRIVSDGPPEDALSPRVLKTVFGLKAQWIEAGDQRLLLAERA